MDQQAIIAKIEKIVRNQFFGECSGHDWWHSHRVRQMALSIAKNEGADLFIVEASALLHDVEDYKFHDGNEELAGKIIEKWLLDIGVTPIQVDFILDVVSNISFIKSLKNKNLRKQKYFKIETAVLHDSDRLDAIGAIGIARTFAFGGSFKREIHNPFIKPVLNISYEEYKNNNSTSINHFYEKLLKLKDTMLTTTGMKIAIERHKFMEEYLTRFYSEWGGSM